MQKVGEIERGTATGTGTGGQLQPRTPHIEELRSRVAYSSLVAFAFLAPCCLLLLFFSFASRSTSTSSLGYPYLPLCVSKRPRIRPMYWSQTWSM